MGRRLLMLCVLAVLARAGVVQADIFDRAERAKDCVQNNNCAGQKWLGRAMALKKCQQEGNCDEKINDSIARNQDRIRAGLGKVETFNRCMNTTDPVEQKECYEIAKASYRARQAKKEEAARALQVLAGERKNLGDAICLPGKIALGLVKVTVKGFVEQINGGNIQIRIADTQGQDVSYQGVSLRQNHVIWDSHGNWIQCRYLN